MQTREVKEGGMIDSSHYLIEITGRKINAKQGDVIKPLKEYHLLRHSAQNSISLGEKAKTIPENKAKALEAKLPIITRGIVYTEDKHKKLRKKWLDGKLHYEPDTCKAKFYTEDGNVIFSRNLSIDQVYDGSELDSARYQFIINEEIGKASVKEEIPTPFLSAAQVKFTSPIKSKIQTGKKTKNFVTPSRKRGQEGNHAEEKENIEPIVELGREAIIEFGKGVEDYKASFVPSSKITKTQLSDTAGTSRPCSFQKPKGSWKIWMNSIRKWRNSSNEKSTNKRKHTHTHEKCFYYWLYRLPLMLLLKLKGS